LLKLLKNEKPDYNYLRELFRQIRKELNVHVDTGLPKRPPRVPTEEEIAKYYDVVWKSRNMQHMVMIKTFLLYTGVRVTELIHIKLSDIDFDRCQIRINQGKGSKDRIVPFPTVFREILAIHVDNAKAKKQAYLFESTWKAIHGSRH
jgi:integrase/recombinase XerD